MDNDLANNLDQDAESSCSTCTEDAPICWICLDGATEEDPLIQPCACPRHCHAQCIARWQLQSAGSRKETHCDFCSKVLPDWKPVLTPAAGVAAPAVMNVNFGGKTYSFEVEPGDEGYKLFTGAIRKAFSLPGDSELNITFTCDDPISGALLTLQGAKSYDAAVYCASISAAKRLGKPDTAASEPEGPSSLRAPTARSSSSRHSSDCTTTNSSRRPAAAQQQQQRSSSLELPPHTFSAPSSPSFARSETAAAAAAPRPTSAPPARPRAASPAARRAASIDSGRAAAASSSRGGGGSAVPDAPSADAQEAGRKAAGHWGRKFRSALGELLGKLQEAPVHRPAGAGGVARY